MAAVSVAYQSCWCSGHGAHPPRQSTSGSPTMFVNGLPVLRVGDTWEAHSDGDDTHIGVQVEGSSVLYVNGFPAARMGDAVDCGSVVAQAAHNLFAE